MGVSGKGNATMEHCLETLETQEDTKEQWQNVNRDYRDFNEQLKNRLSLLRGADRVLMKMHLENGYSYADLSRLAGVSQATISRRIKKIADRLTGSEINAYYMHRGDFDTGQRAIIKDHLREGLSQRKICSRRNISRYRVRSALDKLGSLMRGE
jgi:DNA-directed RNA polymerase specialized sigma24 family protein